MKPSTKQVPANDDLIARMEALGHELGVTSEALEALTRRRKRPQTIAGFPFNLLEWVLRKGLNQLERGVTRIVYSIRRK